MRLSVIGILLLLLPLPAAAQTGGGSIPSVAPVSTTLASSLTAAGAAPQTAMGPWTFAAAGNSFTATTSFTNTTLTSLAGGTLVLGGTTATPTFGATSEGAIWNSVFGGIHLGGQGSTADVTIVNASGATACSLATATTQWSCGSFVPTANAAPTVGVALPAAGKLGLYGTTWEHFSGATDTMDYGVTTGSVLTIPVATTHSNANFLLSGLAAAAGANQVCSGTGGVLTTVTSGTACSVSALRFKNPQGQLNPEEAAKALLQLRPAIWSYKDPEKYGAGQRVGLYADDVANMDDRCAARVKGQLENYMDRCVIAYLVATVQRQQTEIDELRHEVSHR